MAEAADELVVHEGGCHCRRIRWRVRAPSSVVAWKCNCSDCSMRGNLHFSVPSPQFELLGDSALSLTTYQFATHTAKHTFCKVCGITSFYVPRSSPQNVAVTYKCVDSPTLNHVESVAYDRSSAPRDCRVYGYLRGSQGASLDGEKTLLSKFTYDLDKTNAQTYDVLDSSSTAVVDTTRFDFTSNHGNPSYTCIYRVTVHDHEPNLPSNVDAVRH